ncbi:MAG TPA: hypothetical protein VMZ22_07915 [Acidimicrobiales bacterium]|nr:hypothetical protein [Acidimicrobiales bacterium]
MRRPSLPLAISILALIVAMTGTAAAATGGTFILGKANSAGATTALTNTGSGPALSLTAKAGQPALSVSNSIQVPKLNASTLGGKTAGQLTTRTFANSKEGPSSGKEATDPGRYVPWGGTLSDGSPYFAVQFNKADPSTCLAVSFFASNFALGQVGRISYAVYIKTLDGANVAANSFARYFFNALGQHQGWGGFATLRSVPAGTFRATLYVVPSSGTRIVTDFNDSASLMVTETAECPNA